MKLYYLIKHIDAQAPSGAWEGQTDIVWQYDNRLDALDACDRYNTNLQAAGIPSWVCSYSVTD